LPQKPFQHFLQHKAEYSYYTLNYAASAVLTVRSRNATMKLKSGKKRGKRMTLNQLKVGNSAVITTVGGDGALRCRLLDMGLIPHTRVTLQKVAPMGDPIEIRVRGYELTLRIEEAQKIEVEDEPK
jgi:ferrous iron transport protein A